MSDLENKFESTKDKVIGKTKEALGKATGSEETELKGKLQYQKGDQVGKFNESKEMIAKNINAKLDEKQEEDDRK